MLKDGEKKSLILQKCIGYEVKKKGSRLVLMPACSRSKLEKEESVVKGVRSAVKGQEAAQVTIDGIHVSHVCTDADCKVAFCKYCIIDFMKYGKSRIMRCNEAYKLWLRSNKYKRLNLLKEMEQKREPEYWGAGMSHEQWI